MNASVRVLVGDDAHRPHVNLSLVAPTDVHLRRHVRLQRQEGDEIMAIIGVRCIRGGAVLMFERDLRERSTTRMRLWSHLVHENR